MKRQRRLHEPGMSTTMKHSKNQSQAIGRSKAGLR